MITKQVKKYIDNSILCWLATIDNAGMPNVSPKEVFTYENEECLLIANIASPGSVRNIKENPKVCVSFINVFIQKGFKLKGEATISTPKDFSFEKKVAFLKPIAGDLFPIASIISVKVIEVQTIIAPKYHLFPNTTESQQIASAMQVYSVQPK
ncbi:pyridoxamine 5'-phosphate oxidase family protein [Ascidiimonas sp. W6]|uniref:pyridoxamine 5'-phosphate oxidase family protein n=1 Tax=Ascidiimonas meishanensis TaxID=3128903 RepID=UPI0030EC3E36